MATEAERIELAKPKRARMSAEAAILHAALDYNHEDVKRRLEEFTLAELTYLRLACREIIRISQDVTDNRMRGRQGKGAAS